MTHWKNMFPNKYVKAHDLDGKDVTLTIRAVVREKVKMKAGKGKFQDEDKYLIYFEEVQAKCKREGSEEKSFIPNKTNAEIIAGLHGDIIEEWVGKKITLYPTKVNFGRDLVDAIRVREVGR